MRLIIVILALSLAGCATYQRERALLFAPEQLPDIAPFFTIDYSAKMHDAQRDPKPANIVAFVDAGSALSAAFCGSWLQRVSMARRGLVLNDHQMGVAASLTTVLMGVAKANPATVAVVGALETAAQGLSANVQTDVLLAPSQYQAQSTILGLLSSCSNELLDRAPGMRFSQAYMGLQTCARACTFDAASAAVTNALVQTPQAVSPVTGAMTTVTSAAVKDDAGARLIAYWFPGGKVDAAHEARIKAWQTANGVDVSIPFLAHSALYAAARAKAIADLGIGVAP